jgi:hypothetical protein
MRTSRPHSRKHPPACRTCWNRRGLGRPFIIENRPGGGGNIGTEAVVRVPADGYTLLLANATNATNATLYDKLNFNFVRASRLSRASCACRFSWWYIHRFRLEQFQS